MKRVLRWIAANALSVAALSPVVMVRFVPYRKIFEINQPVGVCSSSHTGTNKAMAVRVCDNPIPRIDVMQNDVTAIAGVAIEASSDNSHCANSSPPLVAVGLANIEDVVAHEIEQSNEFVPHESAGKVAVYQPLLRIFLIGEPSIRLAQVRAAYLMGIANPQHCFSARFRITSHSAWGSCGHVGCG